MQQMTVENGRTHTWHQQGTRYGEPKKQGNKIIRKRRSLAENALNLLLSCPISMKTDATGDSSKTVSGNRFDPYTCLLMHGKKAVSDDNVSLSTKDNNPCLGNRDS